VVTGRRTGLPSCLSLKAHGQLDCAQHGEPGRKALSLRLPGAD
jgi:hypothetical protein